ncbi:MAG TPA: hypothetical protein DFK16_07190, partial [Acidimicrobiaceae bacterium]|nr:hypothetical protein [Acidimicrobiaceae bacterium]
MSGQGAALAAVNFSPGGLIGSGGAASPLHRFAVRRRGPCVASLATTAPAGAATVLRVTVRPRVLVCGWSGAGNVGDELLTEVLSTRLRSAGLDPVIRSVSPNATAAAHGGG